jgi:hypothetical protein
MDDNIRAKTGGDTSSSAASHAASRIIAQQWACEQMVLTTLDLDRRDRDSELLALARLHAVSMLDASFLHGGDGGRGGGRRRARSPERALVRRIAREWAASASASPRGRAPGAELEWLGESERERVRSVRERIRMACQGYHGEEEEEEEEASGRLLRGRPQARADVVVTRMAMERQRELQGLSEHRAVSTFAHRGRIQVKPKTSSTSNLPLGRSIAFIFFSVHLQKTNILFLLLVTRRNDRHNWQIKGGVAFWYMSMYYIRLSGGGNQWNVNYFILTYTY